MPGRAQHSRSLVPASRAAGQIGAVQKRILSPDVVGQSQRRVAKRVFEPCRLRALPPAPQPPRPRVRYSPPSGLLLRPTLHGVLLCPHEPQHPRLVQFLHRPRQRLRVRLQPSGDRGAEREVVVCRPRAVRSENGEAGAQRAVPPVKGEPGVVHARPTGVKSKLGLSWPATILLVAGALIGLGFAPGRSAQRGRPLRRDGRRPRWPAWSSSPGLLQPPCPLGRRPLRPRLRARRHTGRKVSARRDRYRPAPHPEHCAAPRGRGRPRRRHRHARSWPRLLATSTHTATDCRCPWHFRGEQARQPGP